GRHRRQGARFAGIRAPDDPALKASIVGRLAAALLAFAAATAGAQALTAPPIAARAYYLVDVLSGQPLAAASENDRFEPASLTKMMTAYLVFAAIHDKRLADEQQVSISARAAHSAGARMFAAQGQAVPIADLL